MKNGERPRRFRLGTWSVSGALSRESDAAWREESEGIGSRPALVSGRESGHDGWRRGRLRLRWPRVFQERVLLSADLPESVPQWAAERVGDLQQNATVFGQREQTEALAIVHHHHFQRGRQ